MRETCSLCNNPADYILVCGCLNLHIHDTITCQQHMLELTAIFEHREQDNLMHLTRCRNCSGTIEEYLFKPTPYLRAAAETQQLATHVATGMITIQEAIDSLNLMLRTRNPGNPEEK
jgi:hypothetical protein